MNNEEAGVGSFAAHCEGYGMGLKPKFKRGDKVRITQLVQQTPDDSVHHFDSPIGMTGVVVSVDAEHTGCPYKVNIPTENEWNTNRPVYPSFFAAEELELVE